MTDLTNEDICRRLAEIAGVRIYRSHAWLYIYGDGKEWNPLESWSQIGPLIERFRVEFVIVKFHWEAWVNADSRAGGGVWRSADNPRRAACLAIIAAHGESDGNV
jgi:hypothetical protein